MNEIVSRFVPITEDDGMLYEYCLMRGFKEEWIKEYKVCRWNPPNSLIRNEDFCHIFLPKGEVLKNHIIFPLFDHIGNLVAFESRDVTVKESRKFKFFPDPMLIFGMNKEVFKKIWDGCNIWVVEGIFDAVALRWITSDIVLSTLTANFSVTFLEFLSRFYHRSYSINILYDTDTGGIKGSDRAYGHLNRLGINSRRFFVRHSKHRDPGDLWKAYGEILMPTLGKSCIS